MLAPRNEAAVAFASTFLFEDWGFLCTKDDFLAAMEKGDLAEAKRIAFIRAVKNGIYEGIIMKVYNKGKKNVAF